MAEVLARVSPEEISDIAEAALGKSRSFQQLLSGSPSDLGRQELRALLRSCFVSRRRADAILDSLGHQEVGRLIEATLDDSVSLQDRLDHFAMDLERFPEVATDLPFELLRFTNPERRWPWTRWMWDPRNDTGALRLLVTDEVDLFGSNREDTYMRVGEAVAFVEGTARAAGLAAVAEGPFGIDVFLGCVYAVYMYTVLRLRMTQEFNRIVPELPELVRRLLGVHQPEVPSCP